MIPARITEVTYNNLNWHEVPAEELNSELEGYSILGAEAFKAWEKPDGTAATEEVALYLQKPGEDFLKVLSFDARYIRLSEKADHKAASPITITVAYI